MTKGEAAKAVATLVCAYPATKWNDANATVYEAMLIDLELTDTLDAIQRLARTSKFMPTIAEIRAEVLDVRHGPCRPAEDAWGDVLSEIRRVGSYGVPSFGDQAVAFVVSRLGWRNLCLEGRNDASDRARFCELYSQTRERCRRERLASTQLLGGALPAPIRELVAGIGKP